MFTQAAEENLEEIMVTGSRIRMTSGMQTPVPITTITTSELAQFEPENTIAEQLDQLPQFMQTGSAQRGGVITGTSGASSLNMRGLGGNRTLVLLDGRRVVPNDRTNVVNVDVFPTALMRNVEVVTGGASAAYGADALAGVVNFVLDREFEGLKISTSTGVTEEHDGQNWNASVAGGRQFGEKLHVIGSIEGRRIHQIDRDMSKASGQWDSFQRWGYVTNPAWISATATPNVPRQITLPDVHSTVSSPTGLITVPGSALNRTTFTSDGKNVRPFVNGDVVSISGPGSTQSQSGGPEAHIADLSFNVGPFGNEVQQESVFLGFQFDATDRLTFDGDLIVSNTESNTYNQPGIPHLGTTTWQATIYQENPFLPQSVKDIMVSENNRQSIIISKMGQPVGVTDFDTNESFHNRYEMKTGSVGFNFDINGNWELSGSYQTGETDRTSIIYNEVRLDRLFMAIDAVRDPVTGAIVCNVKTKNPTAEQLAAAVAGKTYAGQQPDPITRISPVGGDRAIEDCVPLNIFGYGQNSQAAIDYISDDRIALTHVEQDFAEIVLDGVLYEGWGAGEISAAIGLTWRDSSFWQHFETTSGDPLDGPPLNAPDLGIRGIPAGYTGASTSMFMFGGVPNLTGDYDVTEVFTEVNVPLWRTDTGQQLDLNVAGRSSDYSRSGEIVSWKTGLSFQVIEDLRLRGTVSRDVREPSFSELFDMQGTGGTVNDPLRGNASTQITLVNGGNPNLAPEEADTTTIGLVYQPSFAAWAEGLQLSLDWYKIDVVGLIGSLGQQRIVDECLAGAAYLCDYVERDPALNNQITRVENIFLNINGAIVKGVDAEVVYNTDIDFFGGTEESLNLRALFGYMEENSQTNLGAAKLEQAGGPGRPTWTATIGGTYNIGPWGATLRGNYYDSVRVNNMWVEGVDVDDNTTASNTTWNASLNYSGETATGSTWRAGFNITNLFDREPPIIPSFSTRFGAQTVSNEYDVFGRRYQLSFNYDF
jgi:outer membrane receptor protein involved in Fe transport